MAASLMITLCHVRYLFSRLVLTPRNPAMNPSNREMKRIDAVDGMIAGLGAGECNTQRLHCTRICDGLVGDGVCSAGDLAIQRGQHAVLGDQVASAHDQERATITDHPGHHADLLLGEPSLGGGRAAMTS